MRIVTPSHIILREALMFGVMVGAIATAAIAILGGWGFLNAALAGGLLAVIVAFIIYTVGGDLPPPRGPGNLPEPPKVGPSGGPGNGSTVGMKSTASGPVATGGPAPTAEKGGAAVAASTPAPAETPVETPVATPVVSAGTKPALLTEARGGAADDLKKIKGVGPKLEDALNGIGVFHYDQIASWSDEEVAWVDDNLISFKGRATRDEWVSQAKALADGAS